MSSCQSEIKCCFQSNLLFFLTKIGNTYLVEVNPQISANTIL